MNLSPTEEQRIIREAAERFATSELAPVAAALDRNRATGEFLDNLRELAELGFMGLNVDAEFGGTQAGTVAFSLAITELARACASTAVTTSVTNMVAEVIQAVGSRAQKEHYLPRICSGEYRAAAFCLSEAGAGSDPASMKTTAELDGADWIITGQKMWISSAEYAGVLLVWAVTDRQAPPGKGISCFIVEPSTPGVSIGKAEKKMGQRGSATNPVGFDRCRIPADAMLGEENDGYRIAMKELAGGRIGIASLALGVGLAAMDYARDYITERRQFGRPISDFQGLRWQLADAYTELEAARLLIMSAAHRKESGLSYAREASMAKVFTSEAANRACYTAIQMLGGYGYVEECPLERYARDVRVTSIYEGTSEIQRSIIARSLLRSAT